MSRGSEDYVKTIYHLQEHIEKDEFVSNNSLSMALGHTAQTVNEMIKKLVAGGFVIYKPYKGTRLTESGETLAIEMIRKHRLWELFLVKELGYNWDEVHEEAELLEHVTSSKLQEKLYHYLGNPEKNPHGMRIPNLEGELGKGQLVPLNEINVGKPYLLSRVAEHKELLLYLDKIELKLSDQIELVEKDDLNDTYIVRKDHQTYTLGSKVAKDIFLEEI